MTKIFINLPTKQLSAATKFYETIGFKKNPQFSNDDASGLAFDDTIHLMILTESFFKGFIPNKDIADSTKTAEVLIAIDRTSKQEVDAFVDRALAAGAKETKPAYDMGFMYGRDFEDLDGHIWEVFRMDPAHIHQ